MNEQLEEVINMYGKTEDFQGEGRRESDHRFSRMEDEIGSLKRDIKEIGKDMTLVKTKIYNGMGTSIKSTENKVDYIDKANKEGHKELSNDIKDLSKKFDKILWFFAFGAGGVIISDLVKGLL